MKRLFLSVLMLCLSINPMLGMDDDGDQQGAPELGEAALSAIANHLDAGNSHLVRSIAREWYKQNPNGTYREFLDEYIQRRSLPFNVMRSVWLEVMRIRQVGLLQTSAYLVVKIFSDNIISLNCFIDFHFLGDIDKPIICWGLINYGILKPFSPPESFNRIFSYGERQVEDCFDSFFPDRQRYERLLYIILSFGQCLFSRQVLLPCRIIVSLRKEPLKISSVLMQRLNMIAQVACQRGFCTLIQLESKVPNIAHIIVVHNGVIAVVPSIVFPAGASDAECQQIAQDAIARAIDHQPVFRSIPKAIQYLESLDS